jgi:hypothetical protein
MTLHGKEVPKLPEGAKKVAFAYTAGKFTGAAVGACVSEMPPGRQGIENAPMGKRMPPPEFHCLPFRRTGRIIASLPIVNPRTKRNPTANCHQREILQRLPGLLAAACLPVRIRYRHRCTSRNPWGNP